MASIVPQDKAGDNLSPANVGCYCRTVRDIPPYARLLKLRFESEDGSPVVVMPFDGDVVGRPGYLHGGAIAGLLEFAAYTTLSAQIGDKTVAMKPVTVTVDYMRPGVDRETFAAARVERLGASVANVEAFAWQEQRDQPIASARLNFLLDRPGTGASS